MDLLKILNKPATSKFLLTLNIFVGIVVFFIMINDVKPDAFTYAYLADSLLEGKYSFWYFENIYFPDTFRNPGYPLIIAIFRFFTENFLPIQLFQLVLYFLSLFLILKIIDRLYHTIAIKNIFLILLIPSIHVVAYTPAIFPEIAVTFLLICFIWLDLKLPDNSWKKFIILGLIFGLIFQIRPVILFLPFLYALYKFIINRQTSIVKNLAMLVIFGLTMIPYGMWNKVNHGVFKITSLEGGGGVFFMGYWSLKLPDYYEYRYWGIYCHNEMISMIDETTRDQNIEEFNQQWNKIDSATLPLLNEKDLIMIELHKSHPKLFRTHNSTFTLKREELLKKYTIENIKNNLPYYIKIKIYTAIRLWVTGIPLRDFKPAGVAKKIYLIYPFLITLFTFLAGIIFIPYAFYKWPHVRKKLTGILLITLYFGIIHIPFAIQARYTIPVRLELLLMIASSLYFIFFYKHDKKNEIKNAD